MKKFFLFACVSFIFNLYAEKVHAISRYGLPAYPKDMTHFSYVNPNAPKGGTLRLSTVGAFDTINLYAIKGTKVEGGLMCFDPLMYRNVEESFTLYGCVAQSVEVSSDNSQITFHINPEAHFNDGQSITAEDVRFTYEYLLEQGPPVYRNYYSKIVKIEILDLLTVRLTLKPEEDGSYNPELPFNLSLMRPLPKYFLEGKQLAEVDFMMVPCSGPYKISKVDLGRSVEYTRNNNYWAKNLNLFKGMNNFDVIRIDYYKTSQTQFQAFQAGEFDVFFETNPNNWESGYNFPAVDDGRVKRIDMPHERPVAVRTIIYNMKKPIFADWRVRKAISLVFDFDTLNKMVFAGSMQPANSLFANTFLAHKEEASPEEQIILKKHKNQIPAELYETMIKTGFQPARTKGDGDQRENLEKASALLEEAGWKIDKGVRINKKRELLKVELMYKDPKLEKIVLSLKESLRKLGIELLVRMIDTAQYENRVTARDFDMIIHTWANGTSPGNEQIFYFSEKTADIEGSSNYIGLKDPIAEKLAIGVANSKTPEELTINTHTFDRYLMNMCYQIPLFYDNKNRFAYWVNRLVFPDINPKVGTNVMVFGWAPEIGMPEKTQEENLGFFQKIKNFIKQFF